MKAQILISIFLAAFITGCLDTDTPTFPKRIELSVQVDNVGEPLGVNGDTLTIDEFKFVVRKFNLITADAETLQTAQERGFLFDYDFNAVAERLILGVDLGFEDFDRFSAYEGFFDQARGIDNLLDGDFYGTDQNYSIIIRGMYNRDSFLYRSTLTFDKVFEFDNVVTLEGDNLTLWVNKRVDVEDIFIDSETGELINPMDEANQTRIEERFRELVRVEASAATALI